MLIAAHSNFYIVCEVLCLYALLNNFFIQKLFSVFQNYSIIIRIIAILHLMS